MSVWVGLREESWQEGAHGSEDEVIASATGEQIGRVGHAEQHEQHRDRPQLQHSPNQPVSQPSRIPSSRAAPCD